jgi:hypothetical protein
LREALTALEPRPAVLSVWLRNLPLAINASNGNTIPVDEILQQTRLPEGAIVLNIGIALRYAFAPPGVRYKAPYLEMGKELWVSADYELHSILCDPAERAPKKWIEDIISGDVRELTVAILTILVASLHVPLSIAVPTTALILKKQLAAFCRRKPRKPRRSLSEIIDERRPRRKKKRKP